MGWQVVGEVPVAYARCARSASCEGCGSAGQAAGHRSPAPAREPRCRVPRTSCASEPTRWPPCSSEANTVADPRRGCARRRSADYLRWRYAQPPGLDYRAVVVERRGELVDLGSGGCDAVARCRS